jgi:hypothetical protein
MVCVRGGMGARNSAKRQAFPLLKVPIHNVDEFVGGFRLLRARLTLRVDDVVANVPFHNFRHEAG